MLSRQLPLLLLLTVLLHGPVSAQEISVITSPDRASVTVDRQLLLAMFTMRMRAWPDGTPARVFVLPDSDRLHDRFCRELLGTYPYVLRSSWDRLVFTGAGLAPVTVRNESEMREKVRSTPGAIGYALSRPLSFIPAYLVALASPEEGDR
jgi:hypothetical protein